MKKLILLFGLLLVLPLTANAAGGYGVVLEKADNNLRDKDSLQRGAVLFSEYCIACHSVKYMRYNRIARDLGWSDDEVIEKMSYGMNKVVDDVMTRMEEGVALKVLGVEPPDLSLITRVKSTDYVYTFLRGYYQDENGQWNNHALEGTSMPNVLEGIQRHASEEDFAKASRDIANFLEYSSEPSKVQRWDLGWKVILFLLGLLFLTYLLKREYWKDIK